MKREREIAARFDVRAVSVQPVNVGLINETFRVIDDHGATFFLQRLNPIFTPEVHLNIDAVTRRLAECGIDTPRLRDGDAGRPWVDVHSDGARQCWRLMTAVPGVTFDRVQSAEQARDAASFLARWHSALAGLSHTFVGMRVGVHDTARHLDALQEALVRHRDHRLYDAVAPVAKAIAAGAADLGPLPEPGSEDALRIIGHGDPKLNNLVFAPGHPDVGTESGRPRAWIDLDTVGPIRLEHELGDMWRSWCNRAGENDTQAHLDLDVFEASARGYFGARRVDDDAARAAVTGLDWISVELASRFAADALNESYFGWDAARFESRGEHNLERARGQLSLHRAAAQTRAQRAEMIERAREESTA